jgi:hypothetical protein
MHIRFPLNVLQGVKTKKIYQFYHFLRTNHDFLEYLTRNWIRYGSQVAIIHENVPYVGSLEQHKSRPECFKCHFVNIKKDN